MAEQHGGTPMGNVEDPTLLKVQADLVELTGLVEQAMSRATHSLLTADVHTAEAVISDDVKIDAVNNNIERLCLEALSTQTLNQIEVRSAVASLRMATTLERMGDLAAHVAKQARLRYPHISIPAELQGTFARMGHLANEVVRSTGKVIETKDLSFAADISSLDREMDDIHRELFSTVLAPDWTHGVQAAIDVTLLSRYLERFADHGVTVARRVAFVVTGEPYGLTELDATETD